MPACCRCGPTDTDKQITSATPSGEGTHTLHKGTKRDGKAVTIGPGYR